MDPQEKHPEPSRPQTPPPGTPAPRRGRGRLIAALIVIAIAALVLLRWHPWNRTPAGTPGAAGAHGGHMRRGGGRAGAMANLAQPVSVATATTGDMPIVITALGTVTPLATVTVRTQLSGTLQAVYFKEGQMVKKGDVLAQIDPRPYEISLRNAQGQLARDQALLATARLDLQRYKTLLAQDSIARQQVDTQASLVQQYEGTVKSDEANVDTYKLDLVYARITAPVSGRVGLRQVDPGNYVTSGDANGIVVLTQLEPISVIFTTSEDNLPAIMKQMRAGNTRLPVDAYDRANTVLLEHGHLQTIDNQIDTTTGTIRLRASFDNPDLALFPNQFVNARLLVDTIHNAVIVPTSAVLNGSQGQFVYVVKPDNTVTVRLVKVGPVDAERTSIASGLAAGERVVTDGSDRLREGAKITIPAEHPQHGAASAAAASPAAASAAHHHGRRSHAAQGASH